jgi:hypothetical protein
MKNVAVYFLFSILLCSSLQAQVALLGISPQPIANNYISTWAKPENGWGSPNFNYPGNYLEDTIILINDGSSGINAQGNPVSGEGCNSPINSVAGKIAVIYRNNCEYSIKALNALSAGAVGVIIVNNQSNQVIEMPAGSFGNDVNIPVMMVDLADGQTLINSSQQTPTVVRMGNIIGYFSNNLSLDPENTLLPKKGMTPISLAQNGNEFSFHVGTKITNNGNMPQSNITLNVKVYNPNNTIVYNHSLNNLSIVPGNELVTFPSSFPAFQLPSYEVGNYKLVYQIGGPNQEQWPQDNILEYPFSFTNNIFSYSKKNTQTSFPNSEQYLRPPGGAAGEISFRICNVFQDPNASRVSANGLYFALSKPDTALSIQDTVKLYLYKWNNPFYSVNDPLLSYDSLDLIAFGNYVFQSDLQEQSVYGAFNQSVVLQDNQRYLACAQTTDPYVYFGFSNNKYTRNVSHYGQPLVPIEYATEYSNSGISGLASSLGLKLVPVPCPNPIFLSDTILACQSYTGPSGEEYTQSGTYQDIIPSLNGCDSIVTTLSLTILNSGGSFSVTICQGESYNWNGNLYTQPGQYTQTFSNQTACDSVVTLNLSVIPNNANPSFTSTQQTFNAPPFVAQFTNVTPNASNYTFTWDFGDGNTLAANSASVSHEYEFNGQYTVSLIATSNTTGCTDTLTQLNYITCSGGTSCSHSAVIGQSSPQITCEGSPIWLSCNYDTSFTYQWRKNGVFIMGSNSDSLLISSPGTYTVIVIENSCPVESNSVNVNFLPQPPTPTITASGAIVPCLGGSMTLATDSGYSSYAWSNGANTQSISTSISGDYTVTVTNPNGCSSTSLPYIINASFLQTPNICIVGIDTTNNQNRVTWEKPLVDGIDSFYVYKETNVAHVYALLGAVDYDDTAIFVDVNSNPAAQAYRYRIAMLDSCGSETNLSDIHKTIHLTINQGLGGAWNLIWSHYEGINFGSYNIYRGTDANNVTLLTTIQSNLNSYTDLSPPSGIVHYQIEVVNPNDCDPTKINGYGVSRSNIANNGLAELLHLNTQSLVHVYPNPVTDHLTLEVPEELLNHRFTILDAFGRTIFNGTISESKQEIETTKLEAGTYYLSIKNVPEIIRFIKH